MQFAKKSRNANMAPPPLCIFYVLSLLLKTVSRKPRDTVLAKTETGSCVAVKSRAETAPKPKVIHAIRNALAKSQWWARSQWWAKTPSPKMPAHHRPMVG